MKILLIHSHAIIIKLHPSCLSCCCRLGFPKVSKLCLKRSKVSSKGSRFLLLNTYWLKSRLGYRLSNLWLCLCLHLRLSVYRLLAWRSLLGREGLLGLLRLLVKRLQRFLNYFLLSGYHLWLKLRVFSWFLKYWLSLILYSGMKFCIIRV